jgi:hypothetical protein
MAGKQRFHAVVESEQASGGGGHWIVVPFDVEQVYGTRARVPVRVTINGFTFRGSIAPMGGCHLLGLNKEVRTAAKVEAGDKIEVVMERDTEERVVVVPAALAKALKANQAAQAAWDKLSYTHRREHVRAIEEAKKPETRRRRIAGAMAMLAKMKKGK